MAREKTFWTSLAVMLVTSSQAIADTAAWCSKEWDDYSGGFVNAEVPNYSGLLTFWQGHQEKCAGTVLYEARLAFVLSSMGQTERARKVIAPFVGKKTPYGDLIDLVDLTADFASLASTGQPAVTDLRSLETRFVKFVGKYPSSSEGLAMLGGLRTILGEHKTAITVLRQALKDASPAQSKSGIYRNLTISLAATDDFEAAFQTADLALKGNKGLMGDPDFMIAVIRAQSGLGMFAEAQTTARVIAKKNPGVLEDPDFNAAVDFLFEKMNGGKK